MANGDIAAAAGIPKVPPTALVKLGYDEINRALDVIVTEDNKVKARVTPIANGGTAATTAAAAATNLKVPAWTDVAPAGNVINSKITRYGATGKLQVTGCTDPYDVTPKGYVDAVAALLADAAERIDALTARVAALEKKPHP
jgi:hypothetical protein